MADRLKPLAEQVLLGEVVLQVKLALRALDQLESATEVLGTWGAIQSLLVSAANVSKLLWPSRKGHLARGEQLRELLGIRSDDLAAVRVFRNHLEHYDERIDDWFDEQNSASYQDLRTEASAGSIKKFPQSFHRSYDPESMTLSFRGESIGLVEVKGALDQVLERCRPYAFTDYP